MPHISSAVGYRVYASLCLTQMHKFLTVLLKPPKRVTFIFIEFVESGDNTLLCSSDLAVPHPDKKSVIMYVTSLFRVLPQSVSMEAIKEVETLPRATPAPASVSRVTTEEHYEIQSQQRFSQQVRDTIPMVALRHCLGSFFGDKVFFLVFFFFYGKAHCCTLH